MAYRAPHREMHFTGSETVRDVIIGMADGLTVPFALAAGLSGAVDTSFVVLIAGLAEIAAGSIAMGLGGYLSARSEADSYRTELARERREIVEVPAVEREEVRHILASYGIQGPALESAVESITSDDGRWVDFMMHHELKLEEPDPARARTSALNIGFSYIAGGILPLSPYAFGLPVGTALGWSASLTLVALLVFGAVKARFTGVAPVKAALQTALVGGLAAGAAFLLARLVSNFG